MKDKREVILEFYSSPDAILNGLHQAGRQVIPKEQDTVLSKVYELHKTEIERLKENHSRELNAKLEQINKQAETIRDERQRYEIAERIQHEEKQILLDEITENKKLREQLLSALAAIDEHNKFVREYPNAIPTIDFDLSLLHEHDAEVRKPVVEMLLRLTQFAKRADNANFFKGGECCRLRDLLEEIDSLAKDSNK